jgi:hypothetical protein
MCYPGNFISGPLAVLTEIKIDPKLIKGICQFAPQTHVRWVSCFIGMVNIYQIFIPHIMKVVTPLNSLHKQGAKFALEQDQQGAFQLLKCAIS